jgi:hypothetical protein
MQMDNRILVSSQNGPNFFHFEKLTAVSSLEGFSCPYSFDLAAAR